MKGTLPPLPIRLHDAVLRHTDNFAVPVSFRFYFNSKGNFQCEIFYHVFVLIISGYVSFRKVTFRKRRQPVSNCHKFIHPIRRMDRMNLEELQY
jgi:hypothetical protein